MQKQKNPLPKRQRTIRITSPEEKAAQAKWENDHHKAIAGYYFNDTPTLPNLAKGTYHWLMGNVFRENEDPNVTELTVSGWIGSPASKGVSIVRNAKKLGQLLRRGVNKETVRVVTEKAKQAGRSFKKGLKSAIVGDLDDYEAGTRAIRNGINQADDAAPIIVEEAGQAAQAANTVPVAGGGYTQGTIQISGPSQQAAQVASSLANSTNSAVNQGTRAVGQAQRFKKKAAAANKAREATEKELRQARNAVQEANQRATTSESRAAELQRKVEELKQAAAERTAQTGRAAQTGQAAEEAVQTATQAGQTAGQTATQTSRGFWGNVGRVFWETKGNNFGPNHYIARNTLLRVPIYTGISMWKGPWTIGALRGSAPRYLEYAGESFEKGRRRASGDTTTVNTPIENKDTVFINQQDSSQVNRPNTNSNTQFNPGKPAINNDSLTQKQFQTLMNELF